MRLPPLSLLCLLLTRPLVGQQPAAPDSGTRDSTPVSAGEGGLFLALVAGSVILAAAPSAALLMHPNPDTALRLPIRHLEGYLAVGGAGTSSPNTFTLGEHIDLFVHHLYGSLAYQDFSRWDVRLASGTAGYLLRPGGPLAGGLTLGYRRATGAGAEDAALIGLPLVFGSQSAAMWFEATYAISRGGVSWGYRFQGDLYALPRPLFAGLRIEAQPLRHRGDYVATAALLVGVQQ